MKDPHTASEPDNVHAALASVSEELLAILSQLQAFSELPALGACRTWGVESENRPQRGQFLPNLQAHSPAMGPKDGEKWTAAADLQPTIPKSDRLLEAAAAQARTIAANMLVLFRQEMFEHHADEEREVFPAVLRNAAPGHERQRAEAMVRHLTAEHRRMELLWSQLEPAVKAIAKGRPMDVTLADVEALVHAYRAHAGFEERQFLPLAKAVLSRNSADSAALALALHQRRGSR